MPSATATPRIVTPGGDLGELAASYIRALRARNVAPRTVVTYAQGIAALVDFLAAQGMPTTVMAITREHLEHFLADLLERGSANTARNRYSALRTFFSWLVEEGELRSSPMERMRAPRVPEKPPRILTESEVRAVLKTCDGSTFEDRRDTAILRVLIATGARLNEISALRWDPDDPEGCDVDLDAERITVLGKGRRPRTVSIGRKANAALDRYLRVRSRHPHAAEPWLWIARKGRLTDSGIAQMVRERGAAAGIDGLHPHLFRSYWAHDSLVSGANETDVMTTAGWRSPAMLMRYTKAAASDRAAASNRRHNPSDRL